MSLAFKQRLGGRNGFSLVEIFVILIILSIAAAAAVPSYKHVFESMRLKQSAEALIHHLHYGRTHALIHQKSLRLSVDPAGGSFGLEERRVNEEGDAEFVHLRDRWGAVYRISSDFELRAKVDSVELFKDGRMGRSEICICSEKECFSVDTGTVLGQAYLGKQCGLE